MEATFQTKCYQDPAEFYEKRFPWTVVYSDHDPDPDTPVHISADDWSDREITIPLGVIVEIAKLIREKQVA